MNMTCTLRLVCRDESVGESTLTSRINKKRQTKKTPKANQILLQREFCILQPCQNATRSGQRSTPFDADPPVKKKMQG